MTLGGTASDNVGVTWVGWASDRGGSGVATGVTNWSAAGIGLQAGTNVITVTARDGNGNVATDVLTVTYSVPDNTAPAVTISGPTSASTYATGSQTLAISGTASDAVGVTQVTWANNRGGSGTASGTASWSASGITLQGGSNVITVTARDAAGNVGTDTLTVTYTAPDTTAPTVTISSPTTASTYAMVLQPPLTISGTASDNVGVTQVSWVNDRGGSGTATGSTSWSVAGIALQSGTNNITVTARDAAANLSTDVLTVTYTPDTSAPTVTIQGPTSADTFSTTSNVITLGGSFSDDRGVTAITWVNDREGIPRVVSMGATSWSVSSVTLQSGINVITVTAQDATGNSGIDKLTVTYDSASQPAPAPAPTPSLTLSGRMYSSGRWSKAYLEWSSVQGRYMDIYQDGSKVDTKYNSGSATENVKGNGPYLYKVCVSGSNVCSNSITLSR
jgi:hypothetical protein